MNSKDRKVPAPNAIPLGFSVPGRKDQLTRSQTWASPMKLIRGSPAPLLCSPRQRLSPLIVHKIPVYVRGRQPCGWQVPCHTPIHKGSLLSLALVSPGPPAAQPSHVEHCCGAQGLCGGGCCDLQAAGILALAPPALNLHTLVGTPLQAGRPCLLSSRPVPLRELCAGHVPPVQVQCPTLPLRPRPLSLHWQRSAAAARLRRARCSAAAGEAPGAEPHRGGEADETSSQPRSSA